MGKTTLIKAVVDACAAADPGRSGLDAVARKRRVRLRGFYTEERRGDDGRRDGFDLLCFADNGAARPSRTTLARAWAKAVRGEPFIGKYRVDVNNVRDVAAASLRRAAGELRDASRDTTSRARTLCLLDEVGKMEMLCPEFLPAVRDVMDAIAETNEACAEIINTFNMFFCTC